MTDLRERVEVTQEDSELYKRLLLIAYENRANRNAGRPIVEPRELIAAHRLQSRASLLAELAEPTPDMVEEVAKAIEGPHLPVPDGSKHTLEQLRERRWSMLDSQGHGMTRNEATAAIRAIAAHLGASK